MSTRSAEKQSPSSSPGQSPTQLASMTAVLEIVVHSVMEGVKDTKIVVPVDTTIYELKRTIAIATDVAPEHQLLLYKDTELRDNSATLAEYGIVSACMLTMNVKMHTGILVDPVAMERVTFLPLLLPHNNVGHLRHAIRSMTKVQERTRRSKSSNIACSLSTPTKQLEHERTRKKMEALLRKRNKSATYSNPVSPVPSSGSILSRSPPTGSKSPLNQSENISASAQSSTLNLQKDSGPANLYMSEKELKVFFEPAESIDELLRNQQELCLVPETEEELEKRRKELESLEKITCKLCRRKLKLPEQEIRCLCNFVFCQRHREPSSHFCHIDYKGTGRTKIVKENPKVMYSDAHKAQAGN